MFSPSYSPYNYPQISPQLPQNTPYGSLWGNYPTQPATAQNATQGFMELATVQTMAQVEQVSLQAGQRKMVLVQNEPVIAARYADNMGLVSTEYYKLEKFDPTAAPAPSPETDYVTRREFDEFVARLKTSIMKPEDIS